MSHDEARRAVIFDLGGVVLNSPFPAIATYEATLGLPKNAILTAIGKAGEQGAFSRLERGELFVHEFASEFSADCEAIGLPLEHVPDGTRLIDAIQAACTPRPAMLEAIGILRSCDIRTAALTNNFRWGSSEDDAMEEIRAHFDVTVESALEGVRKPDETIYHLTCSRLGVAPSHCIFLDDIGRNLRPAKEIGMETLRVEQSDLTGRYALASLAKMLGGAVGLRLQQSLRIAKL